MPRSTLDFFRRRLALPPCGLRGVWLAAGLMGSVSCSAGKTEFGSHQMGDLEAAQAQQGSLSGSEMAPAAESGSSPAAAPARDDETAAQVPTGPLSESDEEQQIFDVTVDEDLQPGKLAEESLAAVEAVDKGVAEMTTLAVAENTGGSQPVAQGVVDECLKAWKSSGISDQVTKSYTQKKIDVKVDNANGIVVFHDSLETTADHFMIVSIQGQNMNSSIAELLNPKGWYCVHVAAQNMNGFKFIKKKSAQLKILDQSFQNANGFITEQID